MIELKSPEEIEIMAEAGRILAGIMQEVAEEAKIGFALNKLDRMTEKLIRKAGAKPAFLNYRPAGAKRPYKASICTSLNDVVVHGFPNRYELKSGDVLKLDFGVLYKDFYADAATTVLIGEVSDEARKLAEATSRALELAVRKCRPGNTIGDIGFEIESCAQKAGFKTIKGLTGHGIGRHLHEDPSVYNYGKKGRGMELEAGMVLAVEPMLSAGDDKIIQEKDESWATADASLCAHFEHTVAITKEGPRILTKP
jgi:methionyl aminopeptidase